jgi:hypothetical protein
MLLGQCLPTGYHKELELQKHPKLGDALKCRVRFRTKSGQESQAGLVCWRDRNMVHCLSNDSNNFEFDECSRRGLGGIIQIPRPVPIANYNKYMGGVDLAVLKCELQAIVVCKQDATNL